MTQLVVYLAVRPLDCHAELVLLCSLSFGKALIILSLPVRYVPQLRFSSSLFPCKLRLVVLPPLISSWCLSHESILWVILIDSDCSFRFCFGGRKDTLRALGY